MSNTITTIEIEVPTNDSMNVEDLYRDYTPILLNCGLTNVQQEISVEGNIVTLTVKVPFNKVLSEEEVDRLERKYEKIIRAEFPSRHMTIIRMKTLRRSAEKKVINEVNF